MDFWTRTVEEVPSQSCCKHPPFRHLCTIAPSHSHPPNSHPSLDQVLAGSLLLYKGPVRTMELVRGLSASLSERALRPTDLRTRLSDALVITLLYAPVRAARRVEVL